MMDENIKKIRAMVEGMLSQMEERKYSEWWDGVYNSCKGILSFLSGLEKSLPKGTGCEELENELVRFYLKDLCASEDDELTDATRHHHFPIMWDDLRDISRHFYDLGCRRTAEKYDEIEYNRQMAEGRFLPGFEDEPKGIPGKDFVPVEWVETLERYGKWKIVKLEEDGSSEIPKDLLDAQVEIVEKLIGENNNDGANAAHPFACEYVVELLQKAVSAGAKWQADHAPLPEDTVLFYKGLEEGKRLMMEEMSECFAQLKQVQSESINMSAVREQLAYNRGAADERYKMRKKMMEDAVEIGTTEICWVPDGDRVFPTFDPPVEDLLMPGIMSQRFNGGDKVRVIIIKKED